jgi:hypothetical protein
MLQGAQQQHGILAAGHAHGYRSVALVYHVIFVHGLAHNAGEIVEDFVHVADAFPKSIKIQIEISEI